MLTKQRLQKDCPTFEPSSREYGRMTKNALYSKNTPTVTTFENNVTENDSLEIDDVTVPNL